MHLILSSGSPWDCDYYNKDSHQVLFKAVPLLDKLHSGIDITISRVVPPSTLEPIGGFHSDPKETRIKYRGEYRNVKQFFWKTGSFFSRHRAFVSPNGREYVWKVDRKDCRLFLNDPSETPVAVFHCKQRQGFFTQERPASVEIFRQGERMIDLILITLLYVEKLRQDKERSRGGGDGGGDVGEGGGDGGSFGGPGDGGGGGGGGGF